MLTLLTLLLACSNPCPDPSTCDLDDDGVPAARDCDDADPDVGAAADWYVDCDEDGVAGEDSASACEEPDLATLFDLCGDGGTWRAADEPRGDCDDLDAEVQIESPWFADCDADGLAGTLLNACGPPELGVVQALCGSDADGVLGDALGGDCDDEDPAVLEDRDWLEDCDRDGVPSDTAATSCDSPETAGGCAWVLASAAPPDPDCDDEDELAQVAGLWGLDCDADGAPGDTEALSCAAPAPVPGCVWVRPSAVPADPDCADDDGARFPGATEQAGDGVDSDCDGWDDPPPSDALGTFAAPGATGTGCTMTAPCGTIAAAMDRAVALGRPRVYAASGDFTDANGHWLQADLVGGLDAGTWQPAGAPSVLRRTTGGAVMFMSEGDVAVSDVRIEAEARSLADAIDVSGGALTLRRVTAIAAQNRALRVVNAEVFGEDVVLRAPNNVVQVQGGRVELAGCDVARTGATTMVWAVDVLSTGQARLVDCEVAGWGGVFVNANAVGEIAGGRIVAARHGVTTNSPFARIDVRDAEIEVCDAPADGFPCVGVESWGVGVVDGAVIRVGPNAASHASGVWSPNGTTPPNGDITVSDSVILVSAGGAAGYGLRKGLGGVATVAGSLVRILSGATNSSALVVGEEGVLRVVNSVIDPPRAGSQYGLLVGLDGSAEVRGTRFVAAAGGADWYQQSPFAYRAVADFADSCDAVGPTCAGASGNTLGDAGFVDLEGEDWRLTAGSACVDAGVDLGAYLPADTAATDLYGTPRDASPDCGPAEHAP